MILYLPSVLDLLLTHFYIYRQYFIFTKTDTPIGGLSVEDCARRCMDNMEYECLSFSYCFDLGDCFLSHVHADNSSGIVQSQEYCDLYSRKSHYAYPYISLICKIPWLKSLDSLRLRLLFTGYFLDQYTVSSGLTYSVKADATLPNVPSANLCAKLCSQYTAFQCKSFEYCTSTKNCLLLKIHELDMVGNTASPSLTCSFYSSE